MAPNSPARSFIHASMAGSRSTAPLNRSNSILIVALLSAVEIYGHVAPYLPSCKSRHDRIITPHKRPEGSDCHRLDADLEHSKSGVVNNLTSESFQRSYDHAIRE